MELNGTFRGCTNLKSIVIPENVITLGTGTFDGCSSLTVITLPKGLLSIGSRAFNGCTNLTSIAIPEDVSSIGDHAFYDCSSLTGITLPKGVSSLDKEVFYNCEGLTSVEIPGNVKSLYYTFWECPNISEVIFHEGVEDVCGSFQAMNLTTVTLPSTIKNVGYAFCGNKNLKTVYSKAKSAPKWCDSVQLNTLCPPFALIEDEITVYVPAGSKEDYQKNWRFSYGAPIKIVEYDFENNKVI